MDTTGINIFMETVFKPMVIREREEAKKEWVEAINEGLYYGRDEAGRLKKECDERLNDHSAYLRNPPNSPYHILKALQLCIRRYIIDGKEISLTDDNFINDFIGYISYLYEKEGANANFADIVLTYNDSPKEEEFFILAFRMLIRRFEILQLSRELGIPTGQYAINDIEAINGIYKFCIETDVLDSEVISNVAFINAVNTANFKSISNHAETKDTKTKSMYVIYVLSKYMTSDWYLQTAHSIDTEPTKCSGANVPIKWKSIAQRTFKL